MIQASVLMQMLANWYTHSQVMFALVGLIVLDIMMGLAVAFITKTVSSSASWRGMTKKSSVLIVVAAVGLIQPQLQAVPAVGQVPIMHLICTFYCISEVLSILENASRIGVPMPPALVAALSKLRGEAKMPAFPIEVTVTQAKEISK
jgi:toxin secretion/phage lysis holin